MRFIGIDIGAEAHVVAVVEETGEVLMRPRRFEESAAGYERLFEELGLAEGSLVAMEATGHYWKNLFVVLAARGFEVALLNPLRTRRFAEEDLERTKTDAIDALGIARFAAQKRPAPTRLPDAATEELRELVRLRERLVQQLGDHVRQLHRLVDLGFPEFTGLVKTLDSALATALLRQFPTAAAFAHVKPSRVSRLRFDGRRRVGDQLASALVETAKVSVGQHHGEAYQVQVRYLCEDIDTLRGRLRTLEGDIERKLEAHEVGKLLTTIDGIGPLTAARLVAELGDPAEYRDGNAIAAYVGVVPGLKQSGKRTSMRAGLSRIGNARLRKALWMPTLTAVQKNPWLRAYYERLRARGKPAKVALTASMRKLLLAVHSVARTRQPFVPHIVEVPA